MPIVWLGQPVLIFPVGCSTACLFVLSWARLHFGYYKRTTNVQKKWPRVFCGMQTVESCHGFICGKLDVDVFLQNEGKMRNESTK